jgi:hypothetical protein
VATYQRAGATFRLRRSRAKAALLLKAPSVRPEPVEGHSIGKKRGSTGSPRTVFESEAKVLKKTRQNGYKFPP